MMATSYSETNDTAKCSVNWTLMDAWLPEYQKNSELGLEAQGNVSFYVYDDESLYLQNLTHEDPLYFGFSDLGSFGNESDLLEMFGGTTEEENELLEEAGWINNTDRCREFIKQANEQYEVLELLSDPGRKRLITQGLVNEERLRSEYTSE